MSHKQNLTGYNMMNRDNLSRHHDTYHQECQTSLCLQMLEINQNYQTNPSKPHKCHRKQANKLDNQLPNNQEFKLLNSLQQVKREHKFKDSNKIKSPSMVMNNSNHIHKTHKTSIRHLKSNLNQREKDLGRGLKYQILKRRNMD